MTSECAVCVGTLTPSVTVSCPSCDFTACKSCVKRYLLGSSDDAHCMSCRRIWSPSVLTQLLPKSFLCGEWKQHRENVLLDREISMLPETQPYVEQEVKRRENEALLHKMHEERAELKRKLDELDRTMDHARRRVVPEVDLSGERRDFVHPCAANGCDGFLSSAWKCRKCSGWTCADCGLFKGTSPDTAAAHVCSENDKASMDAIKKDSRRCIGCGVYVFKISGCSQMFCTVCHTAWDWRTGRKVNGTIHNPHFFEARRAMGSIGRNVNDIPCGGAPSRDEVMRLQRTGSRSDVQALLGFLQLTAHITMDEIRRYPDRMEVHNNRDLRVKLALNEIERDEMKRKLQQREKRVLKMRDINHIFTMFTTTTEDLLRQCVVGAASITETIPAILQLIKYSNDEFGKLALQYSCVMPSIVTSDERSTRWRIMTIQPYDVRRGGPWMYMSDRPGGVAPTMPSIQN